MLLGPDLPKQPRAGARKHDVLLCTASWKAVPSKVPEHSVLTQHFRAEGKAHAARWDKQCAGFTGIRTNGCWLGCVIRDAAITLPWQGLTESAVWFSQSPSFCAACSALTIISD